MCFLDYYVLFGLLCGIELYVELDVKLEIIKGD